MSSIFPCQSQKSLRGCSSKAFACRYPVLLCSISRRVFPDHAAVDIAVALLLLAVLLLDQFIAVVDADALDLMAVVVIALDAVDSESFSRLSLLQEQNAA